MTKTEPAVDAAPLGEEATVGSERPDHRRLIWGIAAVMVLAGVALFVLVRPDRDSGPDESTLSELVELVEQYLRDGDLEAARLHAQEAVVQARTVTDHAAALRYLGWTTALLEQPENGEVLVVESLALEPDDPNGLYFLARIRFEMLGDAAGALEPLQALEGREMSARQRDLVEQLVADVHAALGAATTTAPP
ncbi:MAG: tetratricopeptide repeat protein [Acidimicrobiales bacterium]